MHIFPYFDIYGYTMHFSVQFVLHGGCKGWVREARFSRVRFFGFLLRLKAFARFTRVKVIVARNFCTWHEIDDERKPRNEAWTHGLVSCIEHRHSLRFIVSNAVFAHSENITIRA